MIEFWFDFGSNYSYLSAMRIEALAASHGTAVSWRPMLLGPIFQELGWSTSPFVLQKEKGAHVWKDMVRQCAKYRLPWRQPSVFPRAALLPSRVALRAENKPWIGAFCRAIFTRNFALDQDIGDPACVSEVLAELGVPPDEWMTLALAPDNKARLRSQTEEARRRGVFGAPSFFIGQEMYWGNDRLDDAFSDLASAAAAAADATPIQGVSHA